MGENREPMNARKQREVRECQIGMSMSRVCGQTKRIETIKESKREIRRE